MRILHIVPSLDPETGGPARSVPSLCKALAGAGAEVTLFTTDGSYRGRRDVPLHQDLKVDGYTIVYYHMILRRPLRGWSFDLVDGVRKWCTRFDLVHVHTMWHHIPTFCMRALRCAGVPYGVTPRGMLDPVVLARHRCRKKVYGWLWERRNVESAAFVHFTAAAEEEKARLSGWRFPASFVVPNAIDLSEWEHLPPRSEFERMFPETAGRPIILFAGRINWVKNLPVLLRAFAVATNKEACLALAGPDPEGLGQELRRLARELGIEERVVFTGMLDCQALRAAYAAADVFVLPSQKENFGMSAAEAIACGVPVVLSSGVDIAREAADAGAGIIADSPEEVAKAIDLLLTGSGNGRRIGVRGNALTGANYSQEVVGCKMRKVYQACLLAETTKG